MTRLFPVVPVSSKVFAVELRDSHSTYQNTKKTLAQTANLRNIFGIIENQEQYGTCTSFSSLQFRMALRKQAELSTFEPAFFANYYEERWDEGTVTQDSGATITEAVHVLEKYGAMPAGDDPYTPDDFAKNPPSDWTPGFQLNPSKVQQINQSTLLVDTLDALNNGHPVLFGFVVFDELESAQVAQTGILSMPSNPQKPIGGHAVNAIGYDESKQMLLVLNQWGSGWGIHDDPTLAGCFWMPFAYYTAYASDAWVGLADDPNQPPTPTPVPNDKYELKVGTDKSSYIVGETANVWVTLTDNGSDLIGQFVEVKISDGNDGSIPISVPGKNGFPWGPDKPGTFTITAIWNTLTATVQAAFNPAPPKPQPTPGPTPSPSPTPQPTPPNPPNNYLNGGDVSKFQGSISWPDAAKSWSFTMIKAIDGRSPIDPDFVANYANAKSANLLRVPYQVGYPIYETGSQAYAAFKTVVLANGGFELPPMLDLEADSCGPCTPVQVTQWAAQWLTLAIKDYGQAIIYSNEDFFRTHIDVMKLPKGTILAVANYSNEPKLDWTFWQHTDAATVPGVIGHVDTDYFKGTLDDLKNLIVKEKSHVEKSKVKVNGQEFDSVVVNDDNYVLWSAFKSLPGFSKKYVNNEWEFTVQPGVDPSQVAQAENLLEQAAGLLKQPKMMRATVQFTKTNTAAVIVTVLGAVKIALSAFGVNLGINDTQVNDIANGVAALVTVAGPLVSYILHRKTVKKVQA